MFRAKAYGKGQKIARTFDSRPQAEQQMLAWIDAGWIVGSVGPVAR